jgi:hypothetical protein
MTPPMWMDPMAERGGTGAAAARFWLRDGQRCHRSGTIVIVLFSRIRPMPLPMR